MINLLHNDCLFALPSIEEHLVDLVLTDPPYGTTQNRWDSPIDLDDLWPRILRVAKPNAAIVFCASEPFTSTLVMSRPSLFKYRWVWDKVNRVTGHLNAKKQPLRQTEDVLVFYRKQPTYNPQMADGAPYTAVSHGRKSTNYGSQKDKVKTVCTGQRYPRDLLTVPGDERGTVGRIHPTQKPVALMRYFIETYSDPGEVVLDFCMGSGTTGVAAIAAGRSFIGIEADDDYFKLASDRILEAAT